MASLSVAYTLLPYFCTCSLRKLVNLALVLKTTAKIIAAPEWRATGEVLKIRFACVMQVGRFSLQVTRIIDKENIGHCQPLLGVSPIRTASNDRMRPRPLTPRPGTCISQSEVRIQNLFSSPIKLRFCHRLHSKSSL